jgi:hypothetical protein
MSLTALFLMHLGVHHTSYVSRVHRDATAVSLEFFKYHRHQRHSLLGCCNIDVPGLQILVCLATKCPSMQLVCCKWPISHAYRMHRRTGTNRLWLRPLRDGAVIPAGRLAFIHGEPPPKNNSRLPPCVEGIFNDVKICNDDGRHQKVNQSSRHHKCHPTHHHLHLRNHP